MLGDIRSLTTGATLVALVVLLAAAVGLARVRGRRRDDGPGFWLHLAAHASVALILSVTLLRDGLPHGIWPGSLLVGSSNGWRRLSSGPLASTPNLLNVALVVSVGLFWTLLTGRAWRACSAQPSCCSSDPTPASLARPAGGSSSR